MLRTLTLALCLVAVPAVAQDDMAAKMEAARAYVATEAQQTVIRQVASPEVIAAQLSAQFPNFTQDQVSQLSQIASEELGPMMKEMEQVMVESVAETFSLDEIEAITAFYETPEGLALANKTGPLMQAVFAKVGPQMQAAQQRIAQRTQELLSQQ